MRRSCRECKHLEAFYVSVCEGAIKRWYCEPIERSFDEARGPFTATQCVLWEKKT